MMQRYFLKLYCQQQYYMEKLHYLSNLDFYEFESAISLNSKSIHLFWKVYDKRRI